MAFSAFGNPGGAMGGGVAGGGGANIQNGPDLEDIQTEALGFLALAGESKLQLLPTAWPVDNLPPPTASLMSVASQKGLIAAAGPDAIVLASTDLVRKAFEGPSSGDGNFKPFQSQMTLPMPMRISQLAFSADESYLVLAAEVRGGLAVYEVRALLNGSSEMAFQLSTNGQSLRSLVPNPTPEKGELFAVVTSDGNLMMANLKERAFVQGPNGQVLKDGVSCLSWSAKGKQLVAGLGNGTAYQMTPEGVHKGDIPKPPGMDSNHHISSITWLENNVFLMVYTPSTFDSSMAPSSVFSIVTRQLPSSFQFQKISEPVGPFGLNRSPPHHFILRLRDFPPNLQDLLVIASTASTDIGLFSRSKTPLAINKPTGVFTMTELSDDSRRAQLPMTGELNDTSPIGFALDLSSKEKVVKPIPSDEIDESQTPLPALMVLNNDGVLASWWIVYSESIRQGTIYPNLISAGGVSQSSPAPAQISGAFNSSARPSFAAPSNTPPIPGFGATSGIGQRQSAWGTPSTTGAATNNSGAFGKPAFGSSAAPASTFGTPNNATPFGKPAFGAPAPASASTPSFGAPAFGATSTPSFGSSGFSTNKTSPWGTAASSNTSFGQPTGLGKTSTPFGSAAPSTGNTAPSSGGFASFASGGGFAAAVPAPSASVFGSKPAESIFGGNNLSAGAKATSFGTTGDKLGANTSTPFGASSNNFVLSSTFKADGSAKDDGPAKSNTDKTSMFGSAFGTVLVDTSNASARPETLVSKDDDMDSTDDAVKTEAVFKPASTTPASTPAPSKASFPPSSASSSGSLFGSGSLATSSTVKPTTLAFGFGTAGLPGTKPATYSFSNLASPENLLHHTTQAPALSKSPSSPVIKEEPSSETERGNVAGGIPDAPLPPDPTSKTSYTAGDTSVSSTGTDAPLPPDFITKAAPKPSQLAPSPPIEKSSNTIPPDLIPPRDVPGGPEDEGDDSSFLSEEEDGEDGPQESADDDGRTEEDEGSGEDITKDVSPTSEVNQTPGFTPQNSFGGARARSTDNTFFTKIEKPNQSTQPRMLFGEVDQPVPILPPPKLQSSPRSPSPIRSAIPRRLGRPEASRSVSAPGIASQILGSQPPPSKSTLTLSIEQQKLDERRRAESRARKEAEETQALVDNRDDELHAFISSDLEPTRTLDEFVAHVESNGPPTLDSIPAQVETVYRDINSMIDTLGLNARALKCFIKGHTEQYKDGGRTKEDLEDEEDWCLVELDDLSVVIEKDLTKELEAGQIKGVVTKLETCNDLQKDLLRLHARHEDIKKILGSHSDPHNLAVTRGQPLSAEQAAQQHDLRRDFTKFQKLLSEAEEALTILKAKVVSQATSSGKTGSSAGPTVEAVMRTITKMTSMAEKRSGDIDVLEGQMRKLRFSSTASVGSREGSPFATPNNRASLRNPGTSSTYGLFYTPDSIKDDRRGFQNSLMSSTSSFVRGSPPRKKMSGYSAEEKLQLKSKLAKKKEVTDRLKLALRKTGTKVRLMGHDE